MSTDAEQDVPIWVRPAPGERRPAYSRERIVATALRIADEEGFGAVSMRRVAAELGAGTMTLYHYVRTKAELVALMRDTIIAELLVPEDDLAGDWREGFAQMARRTRAVLSRHPWIVKHLDEDEGDPAGPNALRHAEQSLAVAARTGLPVEKQFEITAFIDDYVLGYMLRHHEHDGARSRREAIRQRLEGIEEYLKTQLASGEFPHLTAFAGDDPAAAFQRLADLAADDDQRFENGLERILDGIAREIERYQADPR